jgi:hypothetical protein
MPITMSAANEVMEIIRITRQYLDVLKAARRKAITNHDWLSRDLLDIQIDHQQATLSALAESLLGVRKVRPLPSDSDDDRMM